MSSENTPPLGQGLGQHALRLSGRIVAGVGQLLLWALHGLGRLLSPLATRAGGWLNGRRTPPPGGRPTGPTRPYGDRPAPGSRAYGRASGDGPQGSPGSPAEGAPAYGGRAGFPAGDGARAHDGRTRVVGAAAGPAADAPLRRWLAFWAEFAATWWFAPLTGVAVTLAALAELLPHHLTPLSVAGGFAVATTLPLVWRREFLRPMSAVVLGAYAAALLSGQQLMVTSTLAALYTLYTLGRHLDRQGTAVLAVATVASVLVVTLVSNSLDGIPVIASVLAVIAAVGLGDARRIVETAERTEAAAAERNSRTQSRLDAVQREQAVLRERARIARELHDVVAHSVSMIAVQAETAPYTMQELPPEAAAGYQEIARTAREALVEMRRLLSVLRADAKVVEPDTAPQPRLDGLPELVEKHRGAGGNAHLSVTGTPRTLSATVELSAYRIVQEALTNARRHAPGSEVHVRLAYLPDRLAVQVRDDGPGSTMVIDPSRMNLPTDQGAPATSLDIGSQRGAQPPGVPVGGHGLLGMRERATMLGGRFSAGPVTQGGFVVEAELPTRAEGAAGAPRQDPGPS